MKKAILKFLFDFTYGFVLGTITGLIYRALLGPLDFSNVGHLVLFIVTVLTITISGVVLRRKVFPDA